jgi:hypothetical protein
MKIAITPAGRQVLVGQAARVIVANRPTRTPQRSGSAPRRGGKVFVSEFRHALYPSPLRRALI